MPDGDNILARARCFVEEAPMFATVALKTQVAETHARKGAHPTPPAAQPA
jgi:hypothetical protein